MITVSSHQPSLFPWIGTIHKAWASDVHVLSAGVSFRYGDYHNRVPLNGGWLGIPVVGGKRTDGKLLRDVRYDRCGFPVFEKRFRQEFCSKKCPGRDMAEFVLSRFMDQTVKTDFLVDLNMACLKAILDVLNIKYTLIVSYDSSDEKTRTARLMDRIQKKVGLSFVYFAGSGAKDYLVKEELPEGVRVQFQKFQEEVSSDTIMQLIASSSDSDYVNFRLAICALWEVKGDW